MSRRAGSGARPAVASTSTASAVDPLVDAALDAQAGADEEFVERAFREVLRRPPDDEARERALAKLADGTLSRATFVHELVTAPEATRVRELDDAVALGLGARARGERLAWLQAPAGTDERVVEIPWVLSRLVESGRVLEVGYAYAEPAYLAGLLRSGVELVGVDLAERDVEGMEKVVADVRSLPLPDRSVDQVLLVSTLEHVGADNTGYGLAAEDDPASRVDALRELGRVLRPGGTAARHRAARRARRPRLVPARRPRRLERALLVRGPVRRGAGGVRARRRGVALGAWLPGRRSRLRGPRACRLRRPLHGALARAATPARHARRSCANREAPRAAAAPPRLSPEGQVC